MANHWGGTIHKWFAEKMCVWGTLHHSLSPSHNKGTLPIGSICRAWQQICMQISEYSWALNMCSDLIFLITQASEKKKKFHWWKADNSVSNDSGSHEINDKFVLWANVQDILILQHFASDIYVCRQHFHYHKACLIFLSCVRGAPHYRWLSALDLVALSVSPCLSPAVSTYFRTYTHDRVDREKGQQRVEEEEEEGGEEALCKHWGHGANQRGPPCLSPISPAEGFDSPDCLQYWDTQ